MARALRAVGHLEEGICILFLVGIAAVINLQVFSRYLMDDPFIWPEEMSRLFMVWASWWGIAAVTRRGLHIRFDMVFDWLSPRLKDAMETLVDVVTGAFFAFLAYQAFRLVGITAGLEMAATELPTSLLAWPVLLGSALAAVHSGLRIGLRLSTPGSV